MFAWVRRPECPKGAKDEVGARRALLTRSWGSDGPLKFSPKILLKSDFVRVASGRGTLGAKRPGWILLPLLTLSLISGPWERKKQKK